MSIDMFFDSDGITGGQMTSGITSKKIKLLNLKTDSYKKQPLTARPHETK